MSRRVSAPALNVEQLEDRLNPSGSVIPAGEFNWMQYSPTGELGQLVWNGGTLIYRARVAGGWQDSTVAATGTFTTGDYNSTDDLQKATQTAQLVFTSDGTPHALFLEKSWNGLAGKYQTSIRHFARVGGGWQDKGTITPNWMTQWGANNLVAEAGANNSIHLIFSETNVAATGVGNFGSGFIHHATNAGGSWGFAKIADTADLSQDVWFTGGRWTPRFLSLAVDSQNKAHVTYTPQFYIAGAFSTVNSTLMYATNRSGGWASQTIMAPLDGTADAGLGASIAVGPNDQIAVASYYVDRYSTGSPQTSQLLYHTLNNGAWSRTTVASTPDGYVGGDGARFTGFAPQLFFDATGRPNITFSDEAAEHLPVSYANQFAGQIRVATLTGGAWSIQTVYRQTNPVANQLFYPVAATFNGQTTFAGLNAASALDGNRNPIRTDFALVDVNLPFGLGSPPVSPVVPPVVPTPTPTPAPAPVPAPTTPPIPATTTPQVTSVTGWAVALDAGTFASQVHVFRPDGSRSMSVTPFGDQYRGGVRIARGDIDGDGVADLITGTGQYTAARVRVWDGATAALLVDIDPFPGFRGGVFVAAGDLNGDGIADICVGADLGISPHVKVFNGRGQSELASFFAYQYGFVGGVRVAMGDLNRDGYDDVVTAPGAGPGPHIAMFDGRSLVSGRGDGSVRVAPDFYLFAPTMNAGLNVAVGDINGDGYDDLIAGPASGPAHLRVVSGAVLTREHRVQDLSSMFTWGGNTGLRVAAVDADGDGRTDIMTAPAVANGGRVAMFTGAAALSNNPGAVRWFDPLPGLNSGVFVG